MAYCLKLDKFAISFDGALYIARVLKPLAKAAQMRVRIIGECTEFQPTVHLHLTNAALELSGNTKLLHTKYCKLDKEGIGFEWGNYGYKWSLPDPDQEDLDEIQDALRPYEDIFNFQFTSDVWLWLSFTCILILKRVK